MTDIYKFIILPDRGDNVLNTVNSLGAKLTEENSEYGTRIFSVCVESVAEHLQMVNYVQPYNDFVKEHIADEITVDAISGGFIVKTGFHGFFFKYILRDGGKWYMVVLNSEKATCTSEMPLKSMPFEIKTAFVKNVKAKFPEYSDVERLDDIFEEIAVILDESAMDDFFEEPENLSPCMKYHRVAKNGALVLDHEKFGDHVIETQDVINIITNTRKNYLYFYDDGIYNLRADHFIGNTFYEELKGCTPKLAGRVQVTDYVTYAAPTVDSDDAIADNKWFLCLGNCLYDIKNYRAVDYTPERIFLTKLPFKFDEKAECPEFMTALNRMFPGDQKSIDTIQELFGYLFYPEYTIQIAFMMIGTGSNGKGVLFGTINELLGANNCAAMKPQKLSDQFAVGELYNKMVNICGDIPPKSLMETDIFKLTVSEDYIHSDRKYMSPITFKNRAKMIFSANATPDSADESDGFYRRWVILRFLEKFKVEDEGYDANIARKLHTDEELSGIFNWAMVGLKRLLENDDFSCNFNLSFDEKIRRNSAEMNFPNYFMENHTIYTEDSSVTVKDLYELYIKVAESKQTVKVLGKQNFNKFVENYGYEKVKGSDNNLYWEEMTLKHQQTLTDTVKVDATDDGGEFDGEIDDGLD